MEDVSILLIILVSVLVFMLSVIFIRWVFCIENISDNLKFQTNLLKKIAQKNGVSDEDISEAVGINNKQKKLKINH